MAGENYASQYFTPDLGTAMKYADGGSVVAIPRTQGVMELMLFPGLLRGSKCLLKTRGVMELLYYPPDFL